MEQSFRERFAAVQVELKAPKARTNKFGGYKYRSCEDVLKAAKPLMQKYRMILTITDQILAMDGRFYVQATATVRDQDGADCIQTSACAREAEVKKGMDDSQITGTASSYARKYALNGLFCLDDVADADEDLTDGPDDMGLRCTRCGNTVKAHRAAMPGGTNYSAASVAKMTRSKFGSVLCWDCAVKTKGEAT